MSRSSLGTRMLLYPQALRNQGRLLLIQAVGLGPKDVSLKLRIFSALSFNPQDKTFQFFKTLYKGLVNQWTFLRP